ncbi:MAG TPA: class I SAM-dependent methyltransferase [Virgibacillus sp.]|nr:class I SAM-dependent methyltransferase [Virgibacillus sp.]
MEKTNIETLYAWLDQTTENIQQHADEPYLDSLAITLAALFYERPGDHLDDLISHKLATALKEITISEYTAEDIRKSIQLAILKGMQRSTQPQHLITPETVSLLMGYLAGKLTQDNEHLRVFDPVSGSGNLLTTVLGQLSQSTDAYGSEIDPTLIKLGLLNANLQKMNIEFFHQDSLRPFLLDPVDLVVSDLPVGYYPDDIRANDFELKASEGHSYAHHLLIEQSLTYTKSGGYLILLIPEFLFDSDQSDKLHQFLQENTHIVGVLRLPETAFSSKKNVKSVLILQKQGKETIAPKQPLLVDLPSFKDTGAMEDILGQVNNWFAINTKTNKE